MPLVVDDDERAAHAAGIADNEAFPRRLVAEQVLVLLVDIQCAVGLLLVVEQAGGGQHDERRAAIGNQRRLQLPSADDAEGVHDLRVFPTAGEVGVGLLDHRFSLTHPEDDGLHVHVHPHQGDGLG